MPLTYSDLEVLWKNRNSPGRFTLVDASSKEYQATGVEGGAGTITFDLPQPTPGYCRFWLMLTTGISTAVATDRVLLRWKFAANYFNLHQVFPNSTAGIPLIGGGSFQSVAAGPAPKSMDSILVGWLDQLNVHWVVTAASGQTASVQGRFIDLPC
jgi:hypothetical protein